MRARKLQQLASRGDLGPDVSPAERTVQQSIERLLDEATSSSADDSHAAVSQPQNGQAVIVNGAKPIAPKRSLSAALSLSDRDSARSLYEFDQQLAAYHVLAGLKEIAFENTQCSLDEDERRRYGEQSQSILAEALSLVPSITKSDAGVVRPETLAQAVEEFHLPFVGVVLGLAIEAAAIHLGQWASPEKETMLECARCAFLKASRMLNDEMNERHALFSTLCQDALQRLSSPDSHVQTLRMHQAKSQLDDAIRVAMAGLRRHSTCNCLWESLFTLMLAKAEFLPQGDERQSAYEYLLTLAEIWQANVPARSSRQLLIVVELHCKLDRWDTAISLLELAQQVAQQEGEEEQKCVTSRRAVVTEQIRLATSS